MMVSNEKLLLIIPSTETIWFNSGKESWLCLVLKISIAGNNESNFCEAAHAIHFSSTRLLEAILL